jgi:pyrimidine-nucleoside phosphorylase
MRKKIISARKFIKPSFSYLVEKKRDGGKFSDEEIRYIVDSILDDDLPEFQQSALAMAVFFQGMSAQETATFAEEMMLSGEVIDLTGISRPKIDKYSTGGVGDKTTLVLGPLAAACGVVMPTMNGVDEEHVISNLDKLSSIPKFNPILDLDGFKAQLKKVGCTFIKQDPEIAPVDAKFYNLRQQTGTIPSLPLITGSVLSRKLAEGAEGLVIDVKWGNGSFIKDVEQAKQLARSITRVGRSMKRRCVALVTDMNQPLGDTVGTALEIKEAIQLLKGEGPEDLQELVPKRGYVHTINAGLIAEGVQKLAMKKNGKYDPAVGVSEIKKVGTQVKQGEPLMMIHYNDEAKMEEALEYLKTAYRLAPKRPNPPELIVERVA